ncbi:hypothetical protein OESDEN_02139 [Oesophagostomum dentatum]|uniref:Uncharacterized protein n=1 Tax=Oesophagostomum dentatum TaxID=61180 RepID=A0A0B1TPV9_OESDE|nr:hypothetical protein OESDEN_02139 [Oesophagostomum dentatum]
MPASTAGAVQSRSRSRRRSRLSHRKKNSEQLKSILKNENDSSCTYTSQSSKIYGRSTEDYCMEDNSLIDTASIHRRRRHKKRNPRRSKSPRSAQEIARRRFKQDRHRNAVSLKVTFECLTRRRPSRRTDVWWDTKGRARDEQGRFVRTNKHNKDDYKSIN